MIRIDPLIYTIRIYDVDIDTKKKLIDETTPYVGVATVTIVEDIAVVSAIQGKYSYKDFSDLKSYLETIGIITLKWRHNNYTKRLKL